MRKWNNTHIAEKYRENYEDKNKNLRQRKYAERNKNKIRAKYLAEYYIEIPKGYLCEICGKEQAKERHHRDYSKPKEVMLLCEKCHYEEHKKLFDSQQDKTSNADEVKKAMSPTPLNRDKTVDPQPESIDSDLGRLNSGSDIPSSKIFEDFEREELSLLELFPFYDNGGYNCIYCNSPTYGTGENLKCNHNDGCDWIKIQNKIKEIKEKWGKIE
jgi:hypothetical protein